MDKIAENTNRAAVATEKLLQTVDKIGPTEKAVNIVFGGMRFF
jgi:hypothetical protein